MDEIIHHILSDVSHAINEERKEMLSTSIFDMAGAMNRCIGSFNGELIGIARTGNYAEENVMYNGHKRKNILKKQVVTGPDGLVINYSGKL